GGDNLSQAQGVKYNSGYCRRLEEAGEALELRRVLPLTDSFLDQGLLVRRHSLLQTTLPIMPATQPTFATGSRQKRFLAGMRSTSTSSRRESFQGPRQGNSSPVRSKT